MITFETFTHPGTRAYNEDSCGAAGQENRWCFVLCDGLGGHGGGDVASRLAVEAILAVFQAEGWSEDFFARAVQAAQTAILEEQVRLQNPSGLKTTLVCLVLWDGEAHWIHVGDSRLYYFKGGRKKTRTSDHSVPQLLVLSGDIKESEIRFHPDRNRVLRVLGDRGSEPRYDEDSVRLKGTQDFLLCTDGFWEHLTDEELRPNGDPADWIGSMTAKALPGPGDTDRDNLTCVAVHVKTGLFSR